MSSKRNKARDVSDSSSENDSSDASDDDDDKEDEKAIAKEKQKKSKKEPKKESKRKTKPAKKSQKQLVFTEEVVPRIVLLGATGAGKSHLGNTLLGRSSFIVSDNPESCTSESSSVVRGFWLGEQEGNEFEIIDTPGMNDSEGRDTEHIQNIVESLRDYKFVNMFIIVRNGHEIRMTNTYTDMLRMFEMIFGNHFWNNAIFDVSGSLKEKDKLASKRWIKDIRSRFINAKKVKTVFLDVEDEDDNFFTNVNTLWEACNSMPIFACKDIKVVLAEKDNLKKEKEKLEKEKVDAVKQMEALQEAKSKHEKEYEEKLTEAKTRADKAIEEARMIAEKEKKEENQTLLAQVKAMETELNQMGNAKDQAVMKTDFKLQMMEKAAIYKEEWEKEKTELIAKYDEKLKQKEDGHKTDIDEKVKEARQTDKEKTSTEKELRAQIQKLTSVNETSMVSAEQQKKFDSEKQDLKDTHKADIETLEAQINSKEDQIKKLEDEKIREALLIKQEQTENKRRKDEDEKNQLLQKNKAYEEEKNLSDAQFYSKYPALFSNKKKDEQSLAEILYETCNTDRFQREINIPLKQKDDIKNGQGEIAARLFVTSYPKKMQEHNGLLSRFWGGFAKKDSRTIILLGLTGAGKTMFVDSLINYIFDVRYEDAFRLKLIQLTKEEKAKNAQQAKSQTDHIVVYEIQCIPGMKIDYDITIIDTPGFGDTRGVEYDKKLMKNIEELFKSKKISFLDAIGFVAKAGDSRLTAQQNYIFESILHIFGKDVQDNLISILTNHDGQSINILDSFEEANMKFVENFPVNSAAIFKEPPQGEFMDRKMFTSQPEIAQYQKFVDEAEKLTKRVQNMVPRSLTKTLLVLNQREKIHVELQGVQNRVMELLMKKDQIQKETDICNQHSVNATANKDSEYEVEEQIIKMVQNAVGTYVTNCLSCNRTCHYPCMIPNDEDKSGCAAMSGGNCTICPKKCPWNTHKNNQYRYEFEIKKEKKTYANLVKRHDEYIKQHKGAKTVVDALKAEAEDASKEIQKIVPRINKCLKSLQENALRPNLTSSEDYLEQMISAEEHECKRGYMDRIKQLRIEKDRAVLLRKLQEGKGVLPAK